MMTSTFDAHLERLATGERLSASELREFAAAPDILQLGMLADAVRRRQCGIRTTFLRVAACPYDHSFTEAVPPAAREIRITGSPESLEIALSAVSTAKRVAGDRTVSGFAWGDIERLSGGSGEARILDKLRRAGLDAVAELPLDALADPAAVIGRLQDAGWDGLRLSVAKAPAAERLALIMRAGELQDRFGCIRSLDPLPMQLNAFRPTSGYEDVKMVALARLAAPGIPSIQVDWGRYGPKLAQVALTFGADDIYGVSASDEAPEGRRRAPLEEVRRNIEAAGFEPVERDGRFITSA
jgi:aminodeoxyfutalosine synthase